MARDYDTECRVTVREIIKQAWRAQGFYGKARDCMEAISK